MQMIMMQSITLCNPKSFFLFFILCVPLEMMMGHETDRKLPKFSCVCLAELKDSRFSQTSSDFV